MRVEIKRTGRIYYRVSVLRPNSYQYYVGYGENFWDVPTRAWANWKARRVIAKRDRKHAWSKDVTILESD